MKPSASTAVNQKELQKAILKAAKAETKKEKQLEKQNKKPRSTDPKDINIDDFKHVKKEGFRKNLQKFGSFMSGMVMPVVSILIAWGLLAALFLTKYDANGDYVASLGWVKSEWVGNSLGRLIGPMMKYLIPILIAFIAGKMIFDVRGGMIGAFVVMAAIIGNDWLYRADVMGDILRMNGQPVHEIGAANQIVASLSIAPLAAWCFKLLEGTYINKIKPGFEMLTKNFGLAIYVMIFGIAMFFGWGFVMYGISFVMVAIINLFTKANWAFPFVAIFTEPLRALFLNNALNYGVIVPMGMQDTQINHKIASWYYMISGNPGPGFGLLIAYVAWRKKQRANAAGASLIQLVGGIHEVHYVYILAEPIMILSTIGGAMCSLAFVAIFNGGTSAVISPGSIISVIAMSPGLHYIWVNVVAVFLGALASFGIASVIMLIQNKTKKNKPNSEAVAINITDSGISIGDDKKTSVKTAASSKAQSSTDSEFVVAGVNEFGMPKDFDWSKVKHIMVACDAGMGSSALGAGIIRQHINKANLDVDVKNTAAKDLTEEPDIIVTLPVFKEMAREKNKHAYIYVLTKFLGDDNYRALLNQLDEHIEHKPVKKGKK